MSRLIKPVGGGWGGGVFFALSCDYGIRPRLLLSIKTKQNVMFCKNKYFSCLKFENVIMN